MGLGFDRKYAVFTNNRGTPIARSTVRKAAIDLAQDTSHRLKTLTRTALDSGMEASVFRDRFAGILKTAHVQSGMMGRGGRDNTTQSNYGKMGSLIKKQYEFLDGFTMDLIDGNLSEAQAIARAGLYGNSIIGTYGEMEKLTIIESQLNWGRRILNAGAKHCPDCIGFATYPYFEKVENIVAIGVNCRCHGNCRCEIEYESKPPLRWRIES